MVVSVIVTGTESGSTVRFPSSMSDSCQLCSFRDETGSSLHTSTART
ncbi:hypothetical protein [Ornithinimicrobium kibberense]